MPSLRLLCSIFVDALAGSHLLQGFVDAHVHLMTGGLSLRQLDLSSVSSPAQFASVVASAAAEGSGWLLGRGWNNERWGGEMPRASWVDHVTTGRPMLLVRYDLHCALANSAALAAAGLTPESADPPGGVIERDENGELTGLLKCALPPLQLPALLTHPDILSKANHGYASSECVPCHCCARDAAIALVNAVIPKPTAEENRDALDRAMQYFLVRRSTHGCLLALVSCGR